MLRTILTSFVIISGMALLGSCNKCKNCENKLRGIRHALEKNPSTPPKPENCEHCGKGNTKIVLHHNHATGKFVRWACVNCNSRYPFDTLGEHIKDAERWYE